MAPEVGLLACTGFIALVAVTFVKNVVYNLYFHPLRKFPGPLICRATPFYRHYKFLSGELQYAIKSLHDVYGPVVRVRPDELSFIGPQAWKDIHMPSTSAEGTRELARYDRFYHFTGPNSPDTLLTLDKTYHTLWRRQMGPAFSERALRTQEPILQEYASLLVQRLGEESKGGKQPVDLQEWFNYYTFDVIGNLVFGSDFSGLRDSTYHPWVKAVTQNVKEYSYLQVLMYLGFPSIVHLIANSSVLRGKFLHEHLTREKLEARLAQQNERLDLLDPLLKLKDPPGFEQLLANGSQFIIAGSEGTSTLLVGAVSLLADNPVALRKAADEVRGSFKSEDEITSTSVNNLAYLSACLNETLRWFPPVPTGLPRVTPPGGSVICGYPVPGKTIVSVASWAVNHSEEYFSKPFGFHPERFLKDAKFSGDQFETFQPFSIGPTGCPGRNLTLVETRLALAKIIFNFDIECLPASNNWCGQQKGYLLWDKKPFWTLLKPVR